MPNPALLLVVLGSCAAQLGAAAADAPGSSAEQRLVFAKRCATAYQFKPDRRGESEVILHSDPLLRWTNQIVREDDGMLFLWTEGEKGPPVAAAQFFLVEDRWHHEFQSLCVKSFTAQFVADGWQWQPNRPGIEFVRARDSDPPAASPAQRLRQMKAIAERFTAAVDPDGKFDKPEQLRTLATPLYRYSANDRGIADGALFAIVQGTNPEVLLLVEADTIDPSDPFWRYGFARMSCFNLRVYRDEKIVWQRQRAPVPTPELSSPYFFRLNAEPDGSAAVETSSPPRGE